MTKKQKIILGLCVPIAIAEIILLIIFSVILASPPHEQRNFTFIDRGTLLTYCPKVVLPSKESEGALGEAKYIVTSSKGAFVTELKEESDVYAIYYNHLGGIKAQFYKENSFRPSLEKEFDDNYYVSLTEKVTYQAVEIAVQKISLKDEIDGENLVPKHTIVVSFAVESGDVYRMEYIVESDLETEKEKPLTAMKSVIDNLIEKGVIV